MGIRAVTVIGQRKKCPQLTTQFNDIIWENSVQQLVSSKLKSNMTFTFKGSFIWWDGLNGTSDARTRCHLKSLCSVMVKVVVHSSAKLYWLEFLSELTNHFVRLVLTGQDLNRKIQKICKGKKLIGVFPKWSRTFAEFREFSKFRESENHWSTSWFQFKDLLCYLCLCGTVVSSSLTQEIVGLNPAILLIFIFFVTEFSDFSENIWGKLFCTA